MRLKKLEIQGFKSFPDKIKLSFEKGITAVVGPNGSGKSNIADAIRWVLGEQSAKSLRGQKMEDVIFAGTQSRKPLGFAEVQMTVDNERGEIPLDYTEITVSRRVYRSGESEYLINGNGVRLKDIHELFMDTGIGREGYAIISQGKIDDILNVKSDERRLIFEEAAGIIKYKTRCHETRQKLEREHQNLLRLKDIASEIEGNLGPLEKQAEKTKLYLEMAETLKQYEISFFLHDEKRLKKEIAEQNALLSGILAELTEKDNAKKEQQNKEAALTEKLAAAREKIGATEQGIYQGRNDIEKKEGDIKLFAEQISHFKNNEERNKKQVDILNDKIALNREKINMLSAGRDADMLHIASLEGALAKSEKDFDNLNSSLLASEESIESYKTEIIELMQQISECKVQLSRLTALQGRQRERQDEINSLKGRGTTKTQEIDVHIQVLTEEICRLEQTKEQVLAALEENTKKTQNQRQSLEAAESQIERIQQLISSSQARLSLLEEMAKEHEGFYKSVRLVLKAAAQGKISGVKGALGEIISVEKEYETAIATALGNNVQMVVTENEESAKAAIMYLKNTKGGRATFLPLTSAKQYKPVGEHVLKQPGVLGTAKDLISYDAVFEPALNNLLGRVIVFKQLDQATAFSKNTGYQYRCVTLDGELISPSGSYTGGSRQDGQTGLFARGREIEALKQELGRLNPEKDRLMLRHSDLKAGQEGLLAEAENAKNQLNELKIKQSRLEQEKTQQEGEFKKFVEQCGDLDAEATMLSAQLVDTEAKIAALLEVQVEKEGRIDKINQDIAKKQMMTAEDKKIKEDKLEIISNLKVELSTIRQKSSAAKENIRGLIEACDSFESEIEKIKLETTQMNQMAYEKQKQIDRTLMEVDNLKASVRASEEAIRALDREKKEGEIELSETQRLLKELYEDLLKLEGEKGRLENKKDKLEDALTRLYDYLWATYDMTRSEAHAAASDEEPPASLQEKITGLKTKMRGMGQINTAAVEQYQEQKQRFDFLHGQISDIIEAEKKLESIIADLTLMMKDQFHQQFQLISENFDLVFRDMFGGGSAKLVLTDAEKPLESGIDIIVKLPGKHSQNITWLSGGEKALTAIALLFGILRLKPSPFCILDEIEAALDDANINRFSNYLRRFQDETQFIIITHRKGTMEAADILYGVTMQEQGVSKLVSVKLSEAV